MSIALDTALYLREVQLEKPLSLTERGLLFTILFRVGSNPFSWISQSVLATELDLDERNIRTIMKKLINKNLIEVSKDPTDKRKNLYRPAAFLINYHQQNNRKVTKKYRAKSTGISKNISKNTGRNHPVLLEDTGRNHPVLLEEKSSKTPVPYGLAGNENLPKATYKANNIKINKRDLVVDNLILPEWLKREDWDAFVEFRAEIKKPLTVNAKRLTLSKLEKLVKAGDNASEIISESIMNNWTALFPLRKFKEAKSTSRGEENKKAAVNKSEFKVYESREEWLEKHNKFKKELAMKEKFYESQGSEPRSDSTRDQSRGNGVRKATDYLLS